MSSLPEAIVTSLIDAGLIRDDHNDRAEALVVVRGELLKGLNQDIRQLLESGEPLRTESVGSDKCRATVEGGLCG